MAAKSRVAGPRVLGASRVERSSRDLGLTVRGVEILLHSLGVQKRGRSWTLGSHRNRFDPGDGSDVVPCMELERGGWLRLNSSGCYVVTEAAVTALRLAGWGISRVVGQ